MFLISFLFFHIHIHEAFLRVPRKDGGKKGGKNISESRERRSEGRKREERRRGRKKERIPGGDVRSERWLVSHPAELVGLHVRDLTEAFFFFFYLALFTRGTIRSSCAHTHTHAHAGGTEMFRPHVNTQAQSCLKTERTHTVWAARMAQGHRDRADDK